nr:PREDICTED: regulator of chromosome condensation-like [Latimeria chalumnae]|eukprot:XP_014351794.1 PREDICTED: regulator of chromosome condensation-like [Latimeria chalumnae]
MHTACLSDTGKDNNGVIGLQEPLLQSLVPIQFQMDEPVVKIASGNDHLVMLTANGNLYTCGCGDQGQLGRVPERFCSRGGRRGLGRLLVPQCIHLKVRGIGRVSFTDVFRGAYCTFVVSRQAHMYGFGLCNYHQLGCAFSWGMGTNLQLGTGEEEDEWSPVEVTGQQLQNREVLSVSSGGQHTVFLVKQ